MRNNLKTSLIQRSLPHLLSILAAVLLSSSGFRTLTAQVSPTAPVYPPVHAPNAQALVIKVAARHKEAQLVGMHLTPPDSSENVIIACTDLHRVGKPSSEGDLAVIKSLKTVIRRKDKDGVYDVQMSLKDAHGNLIGMVVELVTIASVPDQNAAVHAAESLRNDLEAGIASSQWLFRQVN